MANRHLFGHKHIEAMEFTGEQLWEALGECAAWLLTADHFEHEVNPLAVTSGWDTENMQWLVTLVYDDVEQYAQSAV